MSVVATPFETIGRGDTRTPLQGEGDSTRDSDRGTLVGVGAEHAGSATTPAGRRRPRLPEPCLVKIEQHGATVRYSSAG